MRLQGISHVLAIASGKGGVGKTTVSVNLALALAQAGARAGLFDADLYGPNIPWMLGVRRKQAAPGEVPVARTRRDPYITPLERFGLKVMSVGFVVGDNDAVMPDPIFAGHIIRQTLQDVRWGELDYLLLDFPPGSGEPQRTLLSTIHIDGAVIVTTPQDLALMDASRSLGMFRQAGVPILGVVENMSYLICPHCGERIELFHRSPRPWAVEGDGVAALGRIPMDIAVSRAVNAEHPLVQAHSGSPAATAFREIAAAIAGKLVDDQRPRV
ncbi:MAG: Mrp/NBP35 family ATP-binding protein [Chloroflexi bacterium]|nr:Mrp/NBP35 family ATP-binding protein [Chloroflexota bacterium]